MRHSGVSAMSESQEKSVFADHFEVRVEVITPTGKSFTSSYVILEEELLYAREPIRMLLEAMKRDMSVIANSVVSDAVKDR